MMRSYEGFLAHVIRSAPKPDTERANRAARAFDDEYGRTDFSFGNLSVDIKRLTGSRLADFCAKNLIKIIADSGERHHTFRTNKANLRAGVDVAKYGAAYEVAKARAIEAIAKGIEACKQLPTDEEKAACRKKVLN